MAKISWSIYKPKEVDIYLNKYLGVYYRLNVQYYTLSGDEWVNVGAETLTNYPSGGLPPDNERYYIWGNIIDRKTIKTIFRRSSNVSKNKLYDVALDTKLGGNYERLGG